MIDCPIDGVILNDLKRFTDHRGWLIELFRHDDLLPDRFPMMSYVSMTKPGVARGPHEHREQTDYFCFIGPSTFRLYLWDNRPESPTNGNRFTIDAGEHYFLSVIVPPGVVHAYKNIGSVEGIVYNAPNRLYAGENRQEPVDEIRHEDEADSRFKLD